MEVLTFPVGAKVGKSCLCDHGQSCRKGSLGQAAGQEEQFHPLSDLPAEDMLAGSPQAKEGGLGVSQEEEGDQS